MDLNIPPPLKQLAKLQIFFYRRLTSPFRTLPDFIIIGSQRCGTTSLYRHLSRHPSIVRAFKKEIHFFSFNYHRHLNWYRAHFPYKKNLPGALFNRNKKMITGEATPYYMFHPSCAQRIYSIMPNVKLIVLLRNPVNRTYSHYNHENRKGREHLQFEAALKNESARLDGEYGKLTKTSRYYSYAHHRYSYVARSIYVDQLSQWFDLFARENFLVVSSESLFLNTGNTLNSIFDFLGVERMSCGRMGNYNKASYKRLEPHVRDKLSDFFRPYNKDLFSLIGKRFDWN